MDLTQKLRNVVRAIVGMPEDPGQPPQIDRLAWYRASVTACAADGSTCDVKPEDTRISGENGVKVLFPMPGVTVVVQPGAVVMLGWERGDPARPRCMPIFEAGSQLTKLVFTDANNDSITLSGGVLTMNIAGVTVLQASATSLGLGLVRTLQVLVLGSTDSIFGAPIQQNPAAVASIVKAG